MIRTSSPSVARVFVRSFSSTCSASRAPKSHLPMRDLDITRNPVRKGQAPTRFPTKFNPISSANNAQIQLPVGLVYNPAPSSPSPLYTPNVFLPETDSRKVNPEKTAQNVSTMPALKCKAERKYNLTEEQVHEIRKLRMSEPETYTRKALAQQFNVTPFTISLVSEASPERLDEMNSRLNLIESKLSEGRTLARLNKKKRVATWYNDSKYACFLLISFSLFLPEFLYLLCVWRFPTRFYYDDDDLADYAEDSFSDYESQAEDEGLSPKDLDNLEIGFVQVRSLLENIPISYAEKDIKNLLWENYFDVEKTSKYFKDLYSKKCKADEKARRLKAEKTTTKAIPAAEVSAREPSHLSTKNVESSFSELSLEEIKIKALTKSKKPRINIEEEFSKEKRKPSVNFVVIGHVDAGKSTLMGRLLYDAGAVDEHTIKKFEKESDVIGKGSFALAWVMDQTEEERTRGVTIDICQSSFETSTTHFTVLDAPGHKDFVPNMIAGSSQADFAVLVVDSSTNAFEAGFHLDGQTKEHAILVRSLGVHKIVVAVNKLDSVGWSRERFEEIKDQLYEFLIKIGFAKSQISFVPCSGLNGDNVFKSSKRPALAWYSEGSLLSHLEISEAMEKDTKYPFRMLASDVHPTEHSVNLTVSGRIQSGSVQIGETLYCAPSGKLAVVKTITSNDISVQWAVAGNNISLTLSGIDTQDMFVGDVLSTIEKPIGCYKRIICRVVIFDIKRPLITGLPFVLHRGRTNVPAKIRKIKTLISKADGKPIKKKTKHLVSGQSAIVEIELENPLPFELYKGNRELGRILLRSNGFTVGAGVIDEFIIKAKKIKENHDVIEQDGDLE
ncbi:hypothetical protein NADFUDRAFT_49788 [Nadsonia fulvescens var. elongata DSM 6958]|uniref:Elongation factor 1 alpha-like protein n=1 Tax=Nadsonia fulvescens var. elongata DSM 6958 TaxID=857566 RepID=A0A1E3PQ39_9ASCO|nr:hypothetical protein NADFUDRAFT_49788 [Nadsonia fulvescens var. elongata DSM 6958]